MRKKISIGRPTGPGKLRVRPGGVTGFVVVRVKGVKPKALGPPDRGVFFTPEDIAMKRVPIRRR